MPFSSTSSTFTSSGPMTFSASKEKLQPTEGRAIDHVGFEVRKLEAFCRKLEAAGIQFDRKYSIIPALGIAIAFLTDPWGVHIELTEGLAAW